MSLLDALQFKKAESPKGDVKSEVRRLALEEVQVKHPKLAAQLDELEALGLGMPQLSGEAARLYGVIRDVPVTQGAGLAGSGELGEIKELVVKDVKMLEAVLTEARAIAAKRKPPEAPMTVADQLSVPSEPVASPFPADAPAALKAPADEPAPEQPVLTAEAAIDKIAEPKKGRKKKPDTEVKQPEPEVTPTTEGTVNLYVDCIPNVSYQSLWPIINEITAAMAKEFGGSDYRTTDPNGPLGFGRAKGVLAAAIREYKFAPGNYLLDGAFTDTGSIAVEAMREVVARTKGLLVRGIR